MSMFQVDSQHQGKTSTLVPDLPLLLGLTIGMCPLQSLLPAGRQGFTKPLWQVFLLKCYIVGISLKDSKYLIRAEIPLPI